MIVDDEEGFVQTLAQYFLSQGFDVKSATNLEDAINIFRKEKPKVVLLDFNMPLLTGERFLPLLQSVNPSVRVIVVSGYLEEEVESKFKGLGYFAFFKKGDLELEKLKQKVIEALSY